MSEETFDALQLILHPDPRKRDLLAFREAIDGLGEWTTEEAGEDMFACDDCPQSLRTADNRTPLPSVQVNVFNVTELSRTLPSSHDSGIGASLNSMRIKRDPSLYDYVLSSSLPSSMAKSKKVRNTSHLQFAKSWSDYMDEESDDEWAFDPIEPLQSSSSDDDWLPHWED